MNTLLLTIGILYGILSLPLFFVSKKLYSGKISKNGLIGVRLSGYEKCDDEMWFAINKYGGQVFHGIAIFLVVLGATMIGVALIGKVGHSIEVIIVSIAGGLVFVAVILASILCKKYADGYGKLG